MIDYADDGSFEDAQWGALNPKGFKYGIGGASAQRDYSRRHQIGPAGIPQSVLSDRG
jgi:hypothetical protein